MGHPSSSLIRIVRNFSLTFIFSTLVCVSAHAAIVEYSVSSLGGGNYHIEYTIENNDVAPIALIDILFDPANYDESSINIVTPTPLATLWDETILASSPAQPFAYDILSLGNDIASGSAESGFAVEVLWLAAGAPGAQAFEIYDPDSFALIGSGVTVAATVVPLPLPLLLLFVPSALLAVTARRRRLS